MTMPVNGPRAVSDLSATRPTPAEDLFKRQQVVTQLVTASASAAPSAEPTKAKAFPVAVAVPALIGGMAAAIAGFLLFWWISKRRRREKQRYQRRQARKRNNANQRPSVSASRANSHQKAPISEKDVPPPVPALTKYPAPADPYGQSYGYEHKEYTQYAQQPAIEDTPDHPSVSSTAPLTTLPKEEEPTRQKKPSRSAARVAAAEQAAEANFGDPATRYQPKKPSPLAIAAEQKLRNDGIYHDQRSLSPIDTTRQVSGEWGVALGSPNTDSAYHAQSPMSYANDPYLQANGPRGKSGVYSHDPYASYHGDDVEEMRYQSNGLTPSGPGVSKSNWV
ncbi:hypothetical protein DB88DRAFT_341058 [Papiliotrema laurentii]|uniref:Transmembrane protein n=1 Tax=Papiliotrema laurentii TaxID=5418 RepID=A0AAD9CWG3_PAPLA|nr:hypothetical protein DB88DRAFT_341058 [Papiliotrema laurentii]